MHQQPSLLFFLRFLGSSNPQYSFSSSSKSQTFSSTPPLPSVPSYYSSSYPPQTPNTSAPYPKACSYQHDFHSHSSGAKLQVCDSASAFHKQSRRPRGSGGVKGPCRGPLRLFRSSTRARLYLCSLLGGISASISNGGDWGREMRTTSAQRL